MKRVLIHCCTALLCISILFQFGCKDGQMDDDPLKDLLVKVTGTIDGALPSTWYKPMVMASYPKFPRIYSTNMYGEMEGIAWYVFVEKNSEVQIYLFNDTNMNEAYDWPYEPRIPAATTIKESLKVLTYDVPNISIPIRKVSGTLTAIPSFFTNPMFTIRIYKAHNGISKKGRNCC